MISKLNLWIYVYSTDLQLLQSIVIISLLHWSPKHLSTLQHLHIIRGKTIPNISSNFINICQVDLLWRECNAIKNLCQKRYQALCQINIDVFACFSVKKKLFACTGSKLIYSSSKQKHNVIFQYRLNTSLDTTLLTDIKQALLNLTIVAIILTCFCLQPS